MVKLEFQVILLTIVQAHDYSIKSEVPGAGRGSGPPAVTLCRLH